MAVPLLAHGHLASHPHPLNVPGIGRYDVKGYGNAAFMSCLLLWAKAYGVQHGGRSGHNGIRDRLGEYDYDSWLHRT